MKPIKTHHSSFDIRHSIFSSLASNLSDGTSHLALRTSSFLLLASCFSLLLSCRPLQTTVTERIISDTTIIKEVPKIVTVPGATVRTQSINIDSLAALLKSGIDPQIIQRTLIQEDPETKLRVGILIDRLGNLSAICEQQDRMIQTLEKEITRLRSELTNTETTIQKPVSFWKRIRNALILIGIGMLILPTVRFLTALFGPLPRLPNPFK